MNHYSYNGRIYVRPTGRGICFVDPAPDGTTEQLEDHLAEGYWETTMTFRRLTDAEAQQAQKEFSRALRSVAEPLP